MQTADRPSGTRAPVGIVALGASMGGIAALGTVLAGLPATLPVPVVIVQHIEPHRRSAMAEVLTARTRLRVVEASDRERLEPGSVHVAPPGRDLEVGSDGTVRLRVGPEREHRPRVDALFRSVARAYGPQGLGVVLTGTGNDGAAGAVAISAAGGHVIVEEPSSAHRSAMPSAAVATGVADAVVPLGEVAEEILRRLPGHDA